MAVTASPYPERARRAGITTALTAVVAIGGLIACLPSTPALAETTSQTCNLYASNSGSDRSSGTASAPFLTVRHLIEQLTARQTGCLTSGQTFSGFTLYNGNSHGAEGAPVTITSTNPSAPATINTRITLEKGADWLTFSHLVLKTDVAPINTELPSPTIDSAHTSWTYDDVAGGDINICFAPDGSSQYGVAEYTLIEHDRVHDCGHPVTWAELQAQSNGSYEGRLDGWHAHGIYDEGSHLTVKNSYFYDNARNGIMLRGGSYAIIEHNISDHNGNGLLFGDNSPNHDLVAWNILTNSTSPCGKEGHYCDAYGASTSCSEGCSADIFRNNDEFGNENGNISYDFCSCIAVENNHEVNPLFVNAAAHEYTLQTGSPVVGYGPDTAQPTTTPPPTTETPPPTTVTPPPTTETPPPTTVTPPPTTETSSAPKPRHSKQSRHSAIASIAAIPPSSRLHRRGHRHAKHAKRHHHAKKTRRAAEL
jgi:hypothetical protein